jgi:hypothetical protein
LIELFEMNAGNGDVKVDTTEGKVDFDGNCGGEGEGTLHTSACCAEPMENMGLRK